MKTISKKINLTEKDSLDVVQAAANIIQAGGLVAFPTETVYGLGANALSPEAAAKIYGAKGRPSDNPLIVHIADITSLAMLVKDIGEKAELLMDAFWPGPLTLIFNKQAVIPDATSGGLPTVAIRMPGNKIALELINLSGVPIAAPSANTSGRPSPTTAFHVLSDLGGKIDMILDGGSTDLGLESTIVDVSGNTLRLLRPGAITVEMIERIVGEIEIACEMADQTAAPIAPGMKYKHYAPKADVYIVTGEEALIVKKICSLAEGADCKVGILATDENLKHYINLPNVFSMGSRTDPDGIGRNLFANLRLFDETEVQVIYCEAVAEAGIGLAVMNRLKKAAAYRIIKV